jgi:hypothetical protein
MRVGLLAVCLTVVGSGCFRYQMVDGPQAAVGAELRVHLVEPAPDSVRRVVGAQAVSVDGRLTSASESAITLAVGATHTAAGRKNSWAGESVVLPRVAIASIERRVVDRRRTTWASAMAIAGATASTFLIASLSGKSKGGPDDGGVVTPP